MRGGGVGIVGMVEWGGGGVGSGGGSDGWRGELL